MNTYEIFWTETTVKKVRVEGNTREEAWEAYHNQNHTKPKSELIETTRPSIALAERV